MGPWYGSELVPNHIPTQVSVLRKMNKFAPPLSENEKRGRVEGSEKDGSATFALKLFLTFPAGKSD